MTNVGVIFLFNFNAT